MNRSLVSRLALALLLCTGPARAQSIAGYYARSAFLMAPAGVFDQGLLGFANPANLAFLKAPELRFQWSTDGTDATSINDWGIFSGVRGLGLAALRQHAGDQQLTSYRLSTAFGASRLAFGLGYGWSAGDLQPFDRERLLATGVVFRPTRRLSLGLTGNFSLRNGEREGVAEIGVRPLGTPLLTLFADGALKKSMRLESAPWSAGAVVRLAPGIHLVGRRFDNRAFTFGLAIGFGSSSVSVQSHMDTDQNHSHNTYMVRSGGMAPSIFPTRFGKQKRYVPINLKGRLDYLKFALFDDETHRFLDVLQDLRAAARDDRVAAIALNLSSARMRPENAWEIREELRKARLAGKRVFVFIDNAGMTTYHLASVADKVVMDPVGSLMLEGYALGRTYFKGTLEKLGLGFDEWRFFKYKSALEDLSRDRMSDADREQRQAYVDDWYELVRADVCASRAMTPAAFDQIIDQQILLMPEDALQAGLADTLARWSALKEIINSFMQKSLHGLRPQKLLANALPTERWGQAPRIAVVYGLGACAMDSGIKARWLERVFKSLATDASVKAVVFRVDSPGGDGMASDLVALALRNCSEKKPVIVSQGQVAASGGYWISMYADTIVAAPTTITGSIGVIGGWLYNNGFTQKLGMTADHVQRGAHADLGFGVSLPFIGQQIPERNLSGEERAKVETVFQKYYEGFVKKVAEGRKKSVDEIKAIAEGHFYSGTDGKANGLVDDLGGLVKALEIARRNAGLRPEEEIEIIEIPKSRGLIDLGRLASPIAVELENNPVLEYIKLTAEQPGRPLPLLLPGTYPQIE